MVMNVWAGVLWETEQYGKKTLKSGDGAIGTGVE